MYVCIYIYTYICMYVYIYILAMRGEIRYILQDGTAAIHDAMHRYNYTNTHAHVYTHKKDGINHTHIHKRAYLHKHAKEAYTPRW